MTPFKAFMFSSATSSFGVAVATDSVLIGFACYAVLIAVYFAVRAAQQVHDEGKRGEQG